MTTDVALTLLPELALFALAVVVLLSGMVSRRGSGHAAGWISLIGFIAAFVLTFAVPEGASLLRASFVVDGLALFSKRLFIASAAISLLGSMTLQHQAFKRRSAEYHFALIISVLGMSMLASARELILLFVSFELMSIPLFLLTGFLKRDAVAPEAALKFFLVGTASAATILYGMSFVYGVTGSTMLSAIPAAKAERQPLMMLAKSHKQAGMGFKNSAFPFNMWAPDT